MIISLTGLLQDDSPPAFGAPTFGGDPIAVPISESLIIKLQVVTPSFSVVSLSASSLVLSITKTPQWLSSQLLKKAATVAGSIATFTFTPNDLKSSFCPGLYYYDVWLTDGAGNRDQVVPLTAWTFLPTATPPP